MTRALLIALALGGCAKKQEEPAPSPNPVMSDVEIKQAVDACAGYVTKVCACTTEAAKADCKGAPAMSEAIQLARQVSLSPDAERRTVLQANDSIKKTLKQCIEKTAQLPALGCQ
ncbi:MAG TPA: hypothetical protein VGM39_11535 [Kofleriaceae bacterium]|jgi:hypothetical protein